MLPTVPTGFDGLHAYLTDPADALAAADRIAAGPKPEPKPVESASPPIEAVDRDGNGFFDGIKTLGGWVLGIGLIIAVKACVFTGTKAVLNDDTSSSYEADNSAYEAAVPDDATTNDETTGDETASNWQSLEGTAVTDNQGAEEDYVAANEESKPSPGYATLSMPELQYCLAEDIRMASYKSELEGIQYTDPEKFDLNVDDFNEAVRSYNSACSNRQIVSSQRSTAESNVNGRKYSLEAEGRRRVR